MQKLETTQMFTNSWVSEYFTTDKNMNKIQDHNGKFEKMKSQKKYIYMKTGHKHVVKIFLKARAW